MSSPREWQLIGLNTLFMNLQRLHVFDRASALVAGRTEDEARAASLRGWMDVVGGHFTDTLGGRDLDVEAREALLPLSSWLNDEIARVFAAHDPSSPLREQAAFGAAHVFASDNQTRGEQMIAKAMGDEREADRLLQHTPLMMSLVRQANAAVGSAAEGEPGPEEAGYIAEHVRVAVGDESRVLLQIGAVPQMLEGRDPREA